MKTFIHWIDTELEKDAIGQVVIVAAALIVVGTLGIMLGILQ